MADDRELAVREQSNERNVASVSQLAETTLRNLTNLTQVGEILTYMIGESSSMSRLINLIAAHARYAGLSHRLDA